MPVIAKTVLLLTMSNVFMTFAWYAHLKSLNDKPWYVAAFLSWLVAFVEYMFQVPANRAGFTVLSLGQLKVLQEVITLIVFSGFSVFFLKESLTINHAMVFVPFAVYYMHQPLKLDYLWAGLCLLGAVYFMFRS